MPDHDTVLYNLAGIEQVEWGWGIEGDTRVVDGPARRSTARRRGSRSATATSRCTSPGPRGCGPAARVTDACLDAQAALGIAVADPADDRRAGRDRGPHRGRLARVPGVLRPPAPGAGRARAALRRARRTPRRRPRSSRRSRRPRRSSSRRRTRSCRSGRSSTCRGCATSSRSAGAGRARRRRSPRSSAARRSRGRRTGCSSPPATRRSALGVARLYAGLVDVFVLDTARMPDAAPAIEALGLRAVRHRHDHDRRRGSRPARRGVLATLA